MTDEWDSFAVYSAEFKSAVMHFDRKNKVPAEEKNLKPYMWRERLRKESAENLAIYVQRKTLKHK